MDSPNDRFTGIKDKVFKKISIRKKI